MTLQGWALWGFALGTHCGPQVRGCLSTRRSIMEMRYSLTGQPLFGTTFWYIWTRASQDCLLSHWGKKPPRLGRVRGKRSQGALAGKACASLREVTPSQSLSLHNCQENAGLQAYSCQPHRTPRTPPSPSLVPLIPGFKFQHFHWLPL